MMAFELDHRWWCAFSADDRFHILEDKRTTLCGIGWEGGIATAANWTQCALCAHEATKQDQVTEIDPDGPCVA